MNTSLGELSLPEYNFGLISLTNSSDVFDHDKPFILKHLYSINEDAMVYEWSLKLSQQCEATGQRDTTAADFCDRSPNSQHIDMPLQVRAAKPGPPCRAFNAGNCPSKDHHVYMGYRRLHVCSHCILQKCTLLPH